MLNHRPIPFSILDLAPVPEGSDPGRALRNSLDLAQHAEEWGYTRFWLAEHHNMPGIASAATSVVIGYIGGGTSRIRVGAGGVMLPNHSPLVIAEQFGTLETLYPGRIDLGLGRAPGTDRPAMRALRREAAPDNFPQDVQELLQYFKPVAEGQQVRAVPGEGLNVPVWLLGSSDYSAQLAAYLGLPFAFASHFAPAHLSVALDLYRTGFRPSEYLDRPYAMVAVNVFAADTDDEAARLFTSVQQQFLNLRHRTPGKLPPPVESMDGKWSPAEKATVDQALSVTALGSPETVRRQLEAIIAATDADEIMATALIYDHRARLRSFELLSQIAELSTQPARAAIG